MTELKSFPGTDSRVETLRRFDILDTLPEPSYDDLAGIAALVAGSPVAAICFIDEGRNWVKASFGAQIDELPTSFGACRELLAKPPSSSEIVTIKLKAKSGEPAPVPQVPDANVWIAAPIHSSGGEHVLGAVCIFDTSDKKLSFEQCEALRALGHQVTRLLELRQVNASLELATVKMQVLIDRDAVTGLPTERVFRGHLRTEFQYARRHGQPLSLVMVKVHAGKESDPSPNTDIFEDQIKKLARLLGRDTREYDLIARSGEHEFAIVMRNATSEIGMRVAGRLSARIQSSDIEARHMTTEFGVSSLTPDMVSSRDLIDKARDEFAKQLSAA